MSWRHANRPFAGAAVAALSLVACEISAPEIRALFWQRVVFEDLELGHTYETLVVFTHVGDADGIEDLDSLYVLNDAAELFWALSADDWVVDESDDEPWIGSTGLAMPGSQAIPGGTYRVIVQDLAGETSETEFVVQGVTPPDRRARASAIKVSVVGDQLRVSGPFPSYELWVYRDAGTRIAVSSLDSTIDLVSVIPSRSRATDFVLYVYAATPGKELGYLTGPYFWTRT